MTEKEKELADLHQLDVEAARSAVLEHATVPGFAMLSDEAVEALWHCWSSDYELAVWKKPDAKNARAFAAWMHR